MDSAHEPVAMEINPSYTIVSMERSLKNQIKEMKETKLVNIHTLYSGPEAIVTIILIVSYMIRILCVHGCNQSSLFFKSSFAWPMSRVIEQLCIAY